MPERVIQAAPELQRLKPFSELETVPVSRLARKGTELLSQLTESSQAVAVKVQGVGSMVTMSRRQYDEIVALVREISAEPEDDGFARALSERFDTLLATINQTGAAEAVEATLFGDAETLNATYGPGTTETSKGWED